MNNNRTGCAFVLFAGVMVGMLAHTARAWDPDLQVTLDGPETEWLPAGTRLTFDATATGGTVGSWRYYVWPGGDINDCDCDSCGDPPASQYTFSSVGAYNLCVDVEENDESCNTLDSAWDSKTVYTYVLELSCAAYIPVNDDDDDSKLRPLTAVLTSHGDGGEARLSYSGSASINVYREVDGDPKGQLLTLPWSWPRSHGPVPSLYVEGVSTSSALNDSHLTLSYVRYSGIRASTTVSFTVGLQMRLEKVGNTVIDAAYEYSENTTIRVTAVFANGTPCTGFTGTVNIAEDGTDIYTQHTDKGAILPSTVEITSGGTATFVAKSLADPLNDGSDPPDPALLVTTNYPTYNSEGHLAVPQWTDDLGQVDTEHSSGTVYDWFETRTMHIFDNASGDAAVVFTRVSSYTQFSGGYKGYTPWTHSAQQSIGLNPHWAEMRVNIPDSDYGHTCQVALGPDHSHTVLHEARHAYQDWLTTVDLYQPNDRPGATPNNDDDRDWLVDTVTIAPTNFLLDTTASREKCDGTVTFSGDGTADAYDKDATNDWDYVAERDSEEFAARFYNSVP